MTRYRIHKARSQKFLRKVDPSSIGSVMRLRRSPKELYLELTTKSVPTAIQGFHRVRRNIHGGIDAVITLTISNTVTPEGTYWIRSTHDWILLAIIDYYTRNRRIIRISRINGLFLIWRLLILLVLSPFLIYYHFWQWLKS